MNLEDDLREAFRRKPAPADFAARVLERVGDRQQFRGHVVRMTPRAMPALRWLAAAAVLAIAAAGGTQYYQYQQAAEAERVQAEIRLAFQITSEKLALVQQKLADVNR